MYKTETIVPAGKFHTKDYLVAIGVPEIAPSISPFDPGYDPVTLESHLDQSAHLISILKISMACCGWLRRRPPRAARWRQRKSTTYRRSPEEGRSRWRWHRGSLALISTCART